ncbi:MAG TPA: hypothetical protein PK309_08220 [Bacillota bacterium]|nr:hypothetical protein [Bacillota bacterium]
MFGMIRPDDCMKIRVERDTNEFVVADIDVEKHECVEGISCTVERITGTTKEDKKKIEIIIERRPAANESCRASILQLGK